MASHNLPLGTKRLTSKVDFEDYIQGFNTDDFPRYCAYYSKDIVFEIPLLTDKSINGYVNWVKPIHAVVSETLMPQKIALDLEGGFLAAELYVQFRGLGSFETDNFIDMWGPVRHKEGPLVQMNLWYHLNSEGHISKLEVASTNLLKEAPART